MTKRALLVGNSDGIGLAATRRWLEAGWEIVGVSRSSSPVTHPAYAHHVADVTDPAFNGALREAARQPLDVCLYLAGIGELLDLSDMSGETHVFDVNLMGLVRTAAAVVPGMAERGEGHFVGLSSMADELVSIKGPSYHASKAGFSSYLAGLALALKPRGVYVSNVRFGFVDTKMAKGDVRPFMMSVDKAVDHLELLGSTV